MTLQALLCDVSPSVSGRGAAGTPYISIIATRIVLRMNGLGTCRVHTNYGRIGTAELPGIHESKRVVAKPPQIGLGVHLLRYIAYTYHMNCSRPSGEIPLRVLTTNIQHVSQAFLSRIL